MQGDALQSKGLNVIVRQQQKFQWIMSGIYHQPVFEYSNSGGIMHLDFGTEKFPGYSVYNIVGNFNKEY